MTGKLARWLGGIGAGVAAAAAVWMLVGGEVARAREPRAAAPLDLGFQDLSGYTVRLASLRGHAVALNFWAEWCPPCRAEIPELAAFWRANHDRCFDMLGVAEQSGGADEVARAARQLGIPYPVLTDAGGAAAQRLGISGLPHTVILDAQGGVKAVFEGAIDRQTLERVLEPLLPSHGAPCPRA